MRKILVVEDSQELSDLVQRELIQEGFEVKIATSGPEGLAAAQQYTPDLIILDWMLPGMDGLDVLRRIRTVSPVPVLMLTARNSETDRVVGLELGADDYLTKPFSMRELLARVHALFRRLEHVQQILSADQRSSPAQVQYGQLTLQPEAFLAWLEGQEIELTRTEFALLHLFLRNPGRVFSRAYLQETIWEQSYIPGDRSVDNAILRLRKKLGEPGVQIEAVWGVGYRLRKTP
jgi:DNA-binding response OmpR family regulator